MTVPLDEALKQTEQLYDQAADIIVEQHLGKLQADGMPYAEAVQETAAFALAMKDARPLMLGVAKLAVVNHYAGASNG